MGVNQVSLADRFDLEKSLVLLNGTQALVRLMLMQRARDAALGWNTAGYCTGYRGSPLGSVDLQMARAKPLLEAQNIKFEPGLNEDLAATASGGASNPSCAARANMTAFLAFGMAKAPA